MMSKKSELINVHELIIAIKQTIVERFDGRPLDWQTCEQALAIASLEIKQAALFAPNIEDENG